MNLVQLASDLEFVPKEQLAQMSQDPNTSYPPYLVLAEIQRRTQNDKAYAAMKPQPTSTVAEEVVNEFVQPKGLQAGIPSGSAPTDVFSPESSGMPASAPMQMAASGGLTAYANGGALEESFVNPEQSRISKFGENVFKIGSDVANWATKNPVEAAATGLMFIPGIGWGASAAIRGAGLAYKGLKGIDYAKKAKQAGTFLKNAPVKAVTKPGTVSKTATRVNTNQPLGGAAKSLGLTDDAAQAVNVAGRVYSPLRTTATGTSIYAGKEGYDYLTSPSNADVQKQETDAEKESRLIREAEEKRLADIQAARDKAAEGNITSLSDFVSAKDKAERRRAGLDMAQLGGVILGSQNLTDLGKGITGIASNMQTRDAAEGMAGAQKAYYEAQTGKLQAETLALPAKQLRSELEAYTKYYSDLQKAGDAASLEKAAQVLVYIDSLSNQLAEMQGYASADAATTRDQRMKASGISVT